MLATDRRVVVGWAGGVTTALLLGGAALVVRPEGDPPVAWAEELASVGGSIADLPRLSEDLSEPYLLTVEVHDVFEDIVMGETMSFRLVIRNDSGRDVRLAPCPTYRIALVEGRPAFGAEPSILSEMVGELRCDGTPVLESGDAIEVEVQFPTDPGGYVGPRAQGALAVELWPRSTDLQPWTVHQGPVVESGQGFQGIEGIEGIDELDGIQGVEDLDDLEELEGIGGNVPGQTPSTVGPTVDP